MQQRFSSVVHSRVPSEKSGLPEGIPEIVFFQTSDAQITTITTWNNDITADKRSPSQMSSGIGGGPRGWKA